jgi:cytochrome P450
MVRGTIVLLLVAGIDTTWSAIGSSLWHLAQHPDDRRRLAEDPGVIDFAIEEFLRFYAPVTMARMVAEDIDFHGCPMKKDDYVLLPFPAANRDPEYFDEAERFIIDRKQNRHAAFGLGIHRCLGSNLARLEMKVAIEEFVRRFPDFELAGEATWSVGQVRGPRTLPVKILPSS